MTPFKANITYVGVNTGVSTPTYIYEKRAVGDLSAVSLLLSCRTFSSFSQRGSPHKPKAQELGRGTLGEYMSKCAENKVALRSVHFRANMAALLRCCPVVGIGIHSLTPSPSPLVVHYSL